MTSIEARDRAGPQTLLLRGASRRRCPDHPEDQARPSAGVKGGLFNHTDASSIRSRGKAQNHLYLTWAKLTALGKGYIHELLRTSRRACPRRGSRFVREVWRPKRPQPQQFSPRYECTVGGRRPKEVLVHLYGNLSNRFCPRKFRKNWSKLQAQRECRPEAKMMGFLKELGYVAVRCRKDGADITAW